MRQLHDWLKANPNFFDNPIQKPRGPANEFSARNRATDAQVRYARALLRSKKIPNNHYRVWCEDPEDLRYMTVEYVSALIDELKKLPFKSQDTTNG